MHAKPKTRIAARFALLKKEGRSGLITFLTAGDPDPTTALKILNGLPEAGADLIELGMPFSDPMADGPAIQASSLRALKSGMTLTKTINMVCEFRKMNQNTPVILMGYYNPIYNYGVKKFLIDSKKAGIDGLIIVDLPPEEEGELCIPALKAGINFIYLTAPTTTDERLPQILRNASGFLYYVSITGITGTDSASINDVKQHVDKIKSQTSLPIAVGFGIRTPKQARDIAGVADASVVGSALVDILKANLDSHNHALPSLTTKVLGLVSELAKGIRETKT